MPERPAIQPLLLTFAKPCVSPARWEGPNDEYYYDGDLNLVRWRNGEDDPPAVVSAGHRPPQTKKSDFEKGEDSKDRRMWR
jgi:hypothetical protein